MRLPAALAPLLALQSVVWCASAQYYGAEIGPLSQLHHAVRGSVYAIDSRTLYVRDLHYDGEGPAAYFYVGSSKSPSNKGATRLRDERGGSGPLRRYRGEGVTLALPDGLTLKDVAWFSIWCDEFSVNFGDVSIPRDLQYPRPVKVGGLRGVHGVSSDPIVVVDAQTLLVPHFSYDGEAPDAKFWVGRGDKPSPQGIRIPDENGKEAPLRRYDRKTIVLTLPGELTVFDIGHFAVWCEAFTVNFGHVPLPRHLLASVPPSLKMLGVSPQSRNKELVSQHPTAGAGGGSQGTPQRARRPVAAADVTTYRPHLALRPGPLPAPPRTTPPRSPLHRRADTNTAPTQLLLPEEQHRPVQYKYSQHDKLPEQGARPEQPTQYQAQQEQPQYQAQPQQAQTYHPQPVYYQQQFQPSGGYQQLHSEGQYIAPPPASHEQLQYERLLLEQLRQQQLQAQLAPHYRLVPYSY